MGYTHYYKNKRAFTDTEWELFTEKMDKLLEETDIPVAGPLGDEGTKPEFRDTHVSFNGVEKDSHETACIMKAPESFAFCKTNEKPYDELVVKMYKIAREILGDDGIVLSSDGGSIVFQ